MTEKRKRRRWQFSLRTLLVLVLLGGLGLGLVGRKLDQARKQLRTKQAAVAGLNTLGATLRYAPEGAGWLPRLLGDRLGPVVEVQLKGPGVTDRSLEHLEGLTSLQVLWLDGTHVTDAGLEHLKRLTAWTT
jgi:hypothetical protein